MKGTCELIYRGPFGRNNNAQKTKEHPAIYKILQYI